MMFSSDRIKESDQISELIAAWKNQGERIVFTNGVFDLLHPGHTHYLEEAKSLGTKLVVGVNSDDSSRRLNKGTGRPFNDVRARMMVLAALRSVDLVVPFDEDTPLNLISRIHPDVLVKGGDYSIDQIVGAAEVLADGGEVKQLKFVEGYSTTALEQKIRQSG